MDLNPRTTRIGGHQPGRIADRLDLKVFVGALGDDDGSWLPLIGLTGPGVNERLWTSDERFANEQGATNAAADRLTARLRNLLE